MTVIEVAIIPGEAPGIFKVEVVRSPAGEASAVVKLDAMGLRARRPQMQQALLASAVPTRRILPEAERSVREVGELLFTALLGTGEVAGRYRASAALAAERGRALRVVLRLDSPVLAALPWEAMYDQAAGMYVSRENQLVRHVPIASVPAPLPVSPPLRILGVISSPRGLPALDVDKERSLLTSALARLVISGLAEVHWAPSATWPDLQDLLLGGVWHVVHFIGHGDFDPVQDEGTLALTSDDGRFELVAAHRFVDLLRQARPMPRLVVLNSCSGAATGESDLFSGTAAALVRGGVSAVVAMQYAISDQAASAFARGFYTAVAHGRGADDAVSSGRVSILGTSAHTMEWVNPVLYLRGDDTRLFDLSSKASGRAAYGNYPSIESREFNDGWFARDSPQPYGLLNPDWPSRLGSHHLAVAVDASFWRKVIEQLSGKSTQEGGIALMSRSNGVLLILGAVFFQQRKPSPVSSEFPELEFDRVRRALDRAAERIGTGFGDVSLTWVHTHIGIGVFMSGGDRENARVRQEIDPGFTPIVIDPLPRELGLQIGVFGKDWKKIGPIGIVEGLANRPASRMLNEALLRLYDADGLPQPMVLLPT
jgi:hypothetical protein